MKIAIRYSAVYQYEEKVSLSPHLARIFPRHDLFIHVDRTSFSTIAKADVQYRQDLFGNLIAYCFYPQAHDRLTFDLELDLTIEPKNAFHFLIDSHALSLPFQYRAEEREVLSPFLKTSPDAIQLPQPLLQGSARPTVETLVNLCHWLRENIEYERRDEGEAYDPATLLDRMKGSCRDFAVLMAEVLRQNGVAARLTSGFLLGGSEDGEFQNAENAMHAWVEAYLPGAGWIGLDPTNGVFCDHHFIPTAAGISTADIAPILGHYYGKKVVASTLESNLTVKELAL